MGSKAVYTGWIVYVSINQVGLSKNSIVHVAVENGFLIGTCALERDAAREFPLESPKPICGAFIYNPMGNIYSPLYSGQANNAFVGNNFNWL